MLAAGRERRRPAAPGDDRRAARDRRLARRRWPWSTALAAALVGLLAGGARAGRRGAGRRRAERAAARGTQRAAAGRRAAARAAVALVAIAAARRRWPRRGRRGARPGRPTVALLRGAELRRRAAATDARAAAGFAALGARLALARRGRALATVAVLTVSGAVILLMLGLASLVAALRDDPGSVGKRYAADRAAARRRRRRTVRAIPGVADAAPRWTVRGADSFSLGEPVKLVAFEGDHTRFEDPPLAAGPTPAHRRRGRDRRRAGPGARHRPGGDARRPAAVGRRGALPRGRDGARARGRAAASPTCARARVLAAEPGALAADRRAPARAAPTARRWPRGWPTLGAAPARGGRRDDAQRRLPRHAGHAAARRGRDRRARLPVRARPGAGPDRARAAPDARAAARHGRARVDRGRRAGGRRARRSRAPAALLALALEHWVLAPLVAGLAAGYADLAARPQARGQAVLVAGGLLVAGAAPPRRSCARGAPCASRPSPGCGRSDGAGAPRSHAVRRRSLLVAARPRRGARALRRRRPGRPAATGGSTLRAHAGSTATATGRSSAGPGEPLRDRTDLAPARRARARARHASGSSPTCTCATRSRRRGPPSSTVSARPSRPPSARTRRSRCRSSAPRCARSTPRGPTPCSSPAT